jgi:anion transporter
MSVADTRVHEAPAESLFQRSATGRAIAIALAIVVPLTVWFLPIGMEYEARAALTITSFLLICWMTELLEYAIAGFIGCLLFWAFEVAPAATSFAGFANTTTWFVFAALLLGAISTKSGLPQRVGSFIISRVGASYSGILLGLIVADFLLTFIVPTGVGRVVIMASIAIGLIKLFNVPAGSNVARGIFLIITYTATIFDKMIIAGAAAITARGAIIEYGDVAVTWGQWFIAFLPADIITILCAWRLTIWMFPPEVQRLELSRRDEMKAMLTTDTRWDAQAKKATILLVLGVGLWVTDIFHHIEPAIIAMAVALVAFLPGVGVLSPEDVRKTNILPVLFVGTALSMSAVLQSSGGLALLTDAISGSLGPLLTDPMTAVPVLYWGAFVYHFFLASEISMLASSVPVLMEVAQTHSLNPLWVGLLWTFAAGGKLFVYQSSVLVLGYSYGYFRASDMIKIGVAITLVEFVVVILIASLWWPLIGIESTAAAVPAP